MNEEPPARDEQPDDAAPVRRMAGCGLRAIVGIVAVFGILIAATFVGAWLIGGDAPPDPADRLNAGRADQYAPSDVTYFEDDHVYVVRLEDGSFLALYDRSARAQELRLDCRIAFDGAARPDPLEQLTGFTGAFVEQCEGLRTVWRADGELASGPGYGRLDEYQTAVDENGDLIVDISERTCLRSRGVVGLPPFDEQRCGRPD